MFDVHEKLHLQNQDVKYLQQQVLKAAHQKLELHLPKTVITNNNKVNKRKINSSTRSYQKKQRTGGAKSRKRGKKGEEESDGEDDIVEMEDDGEGEDEEEDALRLLVWKFVEKYIYDAFELTKYSMVVGDKELSSKESLKKLLYGVKSEDEDYGEDSDEASSKKGLRKTRSKNTKKQAKQKEEDYDIEVEPFDFALNEKLRKVYYEVEELTAKTTKKRAEVPISLSEKYTQLANENLAKIEKFEEEMLKNNDLSNDDLVVDLEDTGSNEEKQDKTYEEKGVSKTESGKNPESAKAGVNAKIKDEPEPLRSLYELLRSSDIFQKQNHKETVEDYEESLVLLNELKQDLPRRKNEIAKLKDLVALLESRKKD